METKHKVILRIAGHTLYMSCDVLEKENLEMKENSSILNMEGHAEDDNRIKMIESILETIARDTPNEALMRKVELISYTQLCQRSSIEMVPDFVSR